MNELTIPRSRRIVSSLTLMALLVGLLAAMAVPAHAQTAGVAVFRGCADVRATGPGAQGPDAGLWFPVTADTVAAFAGSLNPADLIAEGRSGTWEFGSPAPAGKCVVGPPVPELCVAVGVVGGTPVVGAGCDINAAGTLGAVAGVGGYCGISAGNFDGTGEFNTTAGTLHLLDVGWVTSAGSVLPVQGGYSLTGPTGPRDGEVVALVQASGGAVATDCAGLTGSDGLNNFDVNAVAVVAGN